MKNLIYIIVGAVIGAVAMYYFCQEDFERPKGIIRTTYADSLSTNWTKYRKPAVDSCAAMGGHKQDDRSVWWSAKEISNYLKFSQKQADSLNINITGYRVYLGVYGQEAGSEKCDLSTMFMVPTGESKNKKKDIMTNNFAPATRFGGPRDTGIPPLNNGNGGQGGYP